MNTWFTSDLHLGHANIIKYCNRPFKTLKEMDETIIQRWNERVRPGDMVYFLGDFCFRRSAEAPDGNVFDFYRGRLNGDIIFVKGNHDRNNKIKTVLEWAAIKLGGQDILLVHDPASPIVSFAPGNKCELIFCGHVHDAWKFNRHGIMDVVNVGVDVWDFRPVSINEITAGLVQWRTRKESP